MASASTKYLIRNIVTLMSGTAVAQVVTVLSAPLITRLFEPGEFGAYGVVIAVASPIAVVAALRYETAIVLPDNDEDAMNLLVLSLCMSVAVACLTLLGIVAFGEHVTRALADEATYPLLLWVPAIVCLTGAFQAATYWYTRHERFREVALVSVGKALTTNTTQVAAGVAGAASFGLLFGHVAGLMSGGSLLWARILRSSLARTTRCITVPRVANVARTYWRFPAYSAPQALINALSRNAPILMLGIFFSPVLVGHYLLAHRVLKAPLTLVSNAFRQAFYPRTVAVARGGGLAGLLTRATTTLALIVAIPCVALVLWAPAGFSLVFGGSWLQAGVYAQALGVWLISGIVAAPSLVAVNVLGLQRLHATVEAGSLAARVCALGLGGLLGDDLLAIHVYAAVGIVANVVLIAIVHQRSRRHGSASEAT